MLQSLSRDYPGPHVLLDGHSSHLFNVEFLNLMKDNNVYILGLPSHTTCSRQTGPSSRTLFLAVFSKSWSKAFECYG